jgi:Putative polyhydroxyalkanoic acid system protein (PHA_gran_rgn)
MPLINLSVKHGRTMEEARSHLETAVHRVHSQFKALIRQVAWSVDRSRVRLDGVGFWVEMWVDAQEVHVSGDLPLLGRLLGSPMTTALQRIVQQTFQKKLP